MLVSLKYAGRSQLVSVPGGSQILRLAPNVARPAVAFDGVLKEPVAFREAMSCLQKLLTNKPLANAQSTRDDETWKQRQREQEFPLRQTIAESSRELALASQSHMASPDQQQKQDQQQEHDQARQRYWKARAQLSARLRQDDATLWRQVLPFDPLLTVADDSVFIECFSADESSYGCLSLDRGSCFTAPDSAECGTTNTDCSSDLFHSLQSLRTYRDLRFVVGSALDSSVPADHAAVREEKIQPPSDWLRGFVELQAAMALPMKKVSLDLATVYSLLASMSRHREKSAPRAIRFELQDGQSPRLTLEPFNIRIESSGTRYHGTSADSVRIWGRRQLLSLARLLPLATQIDVYLTGSGLPSFWVVQMGRMRMTLGLSGWTSSAWTRGTAIRMLFPPSDPDPAKVAAAAEFLSTQRSLALDSVAGHLKSSPSVAAAVMNQLALQGQTFFDLDAGVFRWRPILRVALIDRELGTPHAETQAGCQLAARGVVKIETRQEAPQGGLVVAGKAENQSCEVALDGDGIVRKGKCRCSWHVRFGIRQGPCRHLQALRNHACITTHDPGKDWYQQRLAWSR